MENQETNPMAKLHLALAKAKAEFKPIVKNRTVTVEGTTAKGKDYSYEFSYAEFSESLAATTEPLSKYGLSVSQDIRETEKGMILITQVLHEAGALHETTFPIFFNPTERSTMQDFAKVVTFTKRHAYNMTLGLSADDDNDANDGLGNAFKPKQQNPKKLKTQEPVKVPTDGKNPAPKPPNHALNPSPDQIKRMYSMAKAAAWTEPILKAFIKHWYNADSTTQLTHPQYNEMCDLLEHKFDLNGATLEMNSRYPQQNV